MQNSKIYGIGLILGLFLITMPAAIVNAANDDAFISAACNGQTEVMQLLLDKGVSVDTKSPKGITP